MLGETCFSGAALTLLSIVVAPLLTAMGWLYHDLKASNARLAEATGRLRSGVSVMDDAETELSRAHGRRR